MEYVKHEGNNQQNVEECRTRVKGEKSKQPEDDQDEAGYAEYVFFQI
jgi:hypothetical protein